jgi:hypothetical protein
VDKIKVMLILLGDNCKRGFDLMMITVHLATDGSSVKLRWVKLSTVTVKPFDCVGGKIFYLEFILPIKLSGKCTT